MHWLVAAVWLLCYHDRAFHVMNYWVKINSTRKLIHIFLWCMFVAIYLVPHLSIHRKQFSFCVFARCAHTNLNSTCYSGRVCLFLLLLLLFCIVQKITNIVTMFHLHWLIFAKGENRLGECTKWIFTRNFHKWQSQMKNDREKKSQTLMLISSCWKKIKAK